MRFRVRKDPDPLMYDHGKWEVTAIDDGVDVWLSSWPDMASCHDFLQRLISVLEVMSWDCLDGPDDDSYLCCPDHG